MKKIVQTFIFLIFITNLLIGQDKMDDYGRIAIQLVDPESSEELSSSAKNVLKNKLNLGISKFSMGSNGNSRFVIFPKVSIMDKVITGSTPPMVVYSLSVDLFLGDGQTGELFSSVSIPTKGVGQNETKAFLSSLSKININSPDFKQFIEDGKNNIIKYYNSKCDEYISNANRLADTKNYMEAINSLNQIPNICYDCYSKADSLILNIYIKKQTDDCGKIISQAKSFLSNQQWSEAAEVLADVLPDVSCYSEASSMLNKIDKHFTDEIIRKRRLAAEELARKRKLEDDRIVRTNLSEDRQYELDSKKLNNSFQIDKARIEALRQVGIKQAENQPKNINYNYHTWR